MVSPIIKSLTPLARIYSLSFLKERNIEKKQQILLKEKLRKQANTNIGKELGGSTINLENHPLTTYEFYQKYYENPSDDALLFPISDYLVTKTSGTMGKPKKYLLPKPAILDNMMKTGFAITIISSHNGERFTFSFGDVVYANVPGGNHISTHNVELGGKRASMFVKQVPDTNMSFMEKINYFVNNHENIDYAYMTVPTLLDTVYPLIGEPFILKGFMTQDSSAEVLKEEIKKVTGNYPRVTYGSTESLAATLPSVQYPGCFFFDWRINYVELIPEKDKVPINIGRKNDIPDITHFVEAESGSRYQVVVTPFKADITRYVMPDIIECVSNGDDVLGSNSPVFRYYARSDKIIVLHNFTRIIEKEILEVLHDAEIPFVDFVAKKETEGSKDYMTLYIELNSSLNEKELFEKVNEGLNEYDKDWRDLREYLEYEPLKIKILERGSFNKFLERKTGIARIDRINMRDELIELLKNNH
jgi:GH3 auxin-responsive promoter